MSSPKVNTHLPVHDRAVLTRRFFATIKKLGIDRADVAHQFSQGRTASVMALTDDELARAVQVLQPQSPKAKGDRMRKKIISMAHELGWRNAEGRADMARINRWCEQYGYLHKPLNAYQLHELPHLVTCFEEMYLKHLRKLDP